MYIFLPNAFVLEVRTSGSRLVRFHGNNRNLLESRGVDLAKIIIRIDLVVYTYVWR